MRTINNLYIILFLIFCFNSTYSQDKVVKNYTVDNGLLSSEVYQVYQDNKGYIWFATDEGLSKYDGYNFKSYTNIEGLPDNTVLEIFEDYKNRLWLISISGKLAWIENDSIHIYKHNDVIQKRLSGSSYPIKKSFYVDSLDNVYISFYGSDIIKISNNGNVTEIKPKLKSNLVKVIDSQGILCSSRKYNSLHIDSHKGIWDIKINKEAGKNRVFAIKYKDKIIYLDYDKLYIIDSNGQTQVVDFNQHILWLSKDDNGLLWLGFLKNGTKAYKNLDFTKEVFHLANGSSVSSIIFDNEKACWVTTLENGVYYYPSIGVKNITRTEYVKSLNINKLATHNSSLYFGGNYNYLYEYDYSSFKLHKHNLGLTANNCQLIQFIGDTLCIGNSYVGTRLIYKGKTIQHYTQCAREIEKVGKDTLLLFYINKIRCFANNKLVYLIQIPTVKKIYDVLQLSDSTFLIGTDVGLIQFNYKTKEYYKDLSFREFGSKIVSLYKDGETLYIGTKGAGLLVHKNGELYQYSMKDGIPGNTITSILFDGTRFILGTNNGIVKLMFNNENKIEDLTLFNSGHGLITNGVKKLVVLEDKLFAATNKGLSIIDKNFAGEPSPLYITNCKINLNDTLILPYYNLKHNQNIIEFSFVTLNYRRNKPIKYIYKLEGLSENWIETSDLTVRYNLLPPGDYIFMVKSVNSYGIVSESPLNVRFKINKAYYQTLMFKVIIGFLGILVIFAVLFIIFRIKIKGIRNKNRLEYELNKFRQRALSAQMNPHFIYNSLNSVQSYILKNDVVKSSEYLSNFGNLMRRILENSQKSAISLREELEALKLYVGLEQVRFQDGFKFHVKIEKGINIDAIKVPPLIMQPYVENAIHHGLRNKQGNKDLNVTILKLEEKIRICLEDNGIGIKKAMRTGRNKKNRSYGTEITHKRLNIYSDLLKKDIQVKVIDLSDLDELRTGTRIEIEFNQNT